MRTRRLAIPLLVALGMTHPLPAAPSTVSTPQPVTVSEDASSFTLANGLVTAQIEKRSGTLTSLKYQALELLAQGHGGAEGGYWSSVGRGRPGSVQVASIRINPATNNGALAEVSCRLQNDAHSASSPVDADYRYALRSGEHWLYVYSVLEHKPGYPAFSVGEARYCAKLNPEIFDYLSVDAQRRRVMPSGKDWDSGAPLNLKEARRMTTGVHKGEVEHKYDYSAVLAETPAYGWSSTKHNVGLWLINPSQEYIGGGPTKAELTAHLDVNPGGLPTLLNMWVGSHYGGTSLSVATNEAWTKVVGPFLLYCNTAGGQEALWQDALERASNEAGFWPYAWLADPNYPRASERGRITGRIALRDAHDPTAAMSNLWVGVAAPDYVPPPRFGGSGFGFGRRAITTNSLAGAATNFAGRPFSGFANGGFPGEVDWQRDAKFYQFWTRADASGRFAIRNIRPGNFTLHAIADGVLGEFALSNITVTPGETKALDELAWHPARFGRTVWQIGVPDRTAREFRHGDRFWQWGLYFGYPKEFPDDVNFIVGQSDWRRDWNYVQPPRIENRAVPATGEDDEQTELVTNGGARSGRGQVRETTWRIRFEMTDVPRGQATLRLAFCGTHAGCNVEASVNDKPIGETGVLPSTSAMQRDGIRAYWIEKRLGFDGGLLKSGSNTLALTSRANSWSQGVMYDCVRLELEEGK